MSPRDTDFFVALESSVWDGLVSGDDRAERELLPADFLGVYPTGFATAAEHAGQLAAGPTVGSYRLSDSRVVEIAPDAVLLSYRAEYRRLEPDEDRSMYVTSLWVRRHDRWWNAFSQDTPAVD